MRPDDFNLFSTVVKLRSGLLLTPEKAYLLESRLLPIARKYNLQSLEDMAQTIRVNRDEATLHAVTEAMMINESCFFRDRKPFALFQKVLLPQLLVSRAAKKHIRIWSAGTSSGQEAYSLAMICLEEAEKLQGWKIDIVGTDLSKDMITRAKSGIYTQFEVQRGLPIAMLVKNFQKHSGDKWQIKDTLRQMVQFREANLLHDFGQIGIFDIIYCRNVVTHFDQTPKKRVMESLAAVLASDGLLLLGASESALGATDKLKPSGTEYMSYCLATSQPFVANQYATG